MPTLAELVAKDTGARKKKTLAELMAEGGAEPVAIEVVGEASPRVGPYPEGSTREERFALSAKRQGITPEKFRENIKTITTDTVAGDRLRVGAPAEELEAYRRAFVTDLDTAQNDTLLVNTFSPKAIIERVSTTEEEADKANTPGKATALGMKKALASALAPGQYGAQVVGGLGRMAYDKTINALSGAEIEETPLPLGFKDVNVAGWQPPSKVALDPSTSRFYRGEKDGSPVGTSGTQPAPVIHDLVTKVVGEEPNTVPVAARIGGKFLDDMITPENAMFAVGMVNKLPRALQTATHAFFGSEGAHMVGNGWENLKKASTSEEIVNASAEYLAGIFMMYPYAGKVAKEGAARGYTAQDMKIIKEAVAKDAEARGLTKTLPEGKTANDVPIADIERGILQQKRLDYGLRGEGAFGTKTKKPPVEKSVMDEAAWLRHGVSNIFSKFAKVKPDGLGGYDISDAKGTFQLKIKKGENRVSPADVEAMWKAQPEVLAKEMGVDPSLPWERVANVAIEKFSGSQAPGKFTLTTKGGREIPAEGLIELSAMADKSTMPHELAHAAYEMGLLSEAEYSAISKKFGVEQGTGRASEAFATASEPLSAMEKLKRTVKERASGLYNLLTADASRAMSNVEAEATRKGPPTDGAAPTDLSLVNEAVRAVQSGDVTQRPAIPPEMWRGEPVRALPPAPPEVLARETAQRAAQQATQDAETAAYEARARGMAEEARRAEIAALPFSRPGQPVAPPPGPPPGPPPRSVLGPPGKDRTRAYLDDLLEKGEITPEQHEAGMRGVDALPDVPKKSDLVERGVPPEVAAAVAEAIKAGQKERVAEKEKAFEAARARVEAEAEHFAPKEPAPAEPPKVSTPAQPEPSKASTPETGDALELGKVAEAVAGALRKAGFGGETGRSTITDGGAAKALRVSPVEANSLLGLLEQEGMVGPSQGKMGSRKVLFQMPKARRSQRDRTSLAYRARAERTGVIQKFILGLVDNETGKRIYDAPEDIPGKLYEIIDDIVFSSHPSEVPQWDAAEGYIRKARALEGRMARLADRPGREKTLVAYGVASSSPVDAKNKTFRVGSARGVKSGDAPQVGEYLVYSPESVDPSRPGRYVYKTNPESPFEPLPGHTGPSGKLRAMIRDFQGKDPGYKQLASELQGLENQKLDIEEWFGKALEEDYARAGKESGRPLDESDRSMVREAAEGGEGSALLGSGYEFRLSENTVRRAKELLKTQVKIASTRTYSDELVKDYSESQGFADARDDVIAGRTFQGQGIRSVPAKRLRSTEEMHQEEASLLGVTGWQSRDAKPVGRAIRKVAKWAEERLPEEDSAEAIHKANDIVTAYRNGPRGYAEAERAIRETVLGDKGTGAREEIPEDVVHGVMFIAGEAELVKRQTGARAPLGPTFSGINKERFRPEDVRAVVRAEHSPAWEDELKADYGVDVPVFTYNTHGRSLVELEKQKVRDAVDNAKPGDYPAIDKLQGEYDRAHYDYSIKKRDSIHAGAQIIDDAMGNPAKDDPGLRSRIQTVVAGVVTSPEKHGNISLNEAVQRVREEITKRNFPFTNGDRTDSYLGILDAVSRSDAFRSIYQEVENAGRAREAAVRALNSGTREELARQQSAVDKKYENDPWASKPASLENAIVRAATVTNSLFQAPAGKKRKRGIPDLVAYTAMSSEGIRKLLSDGYSSPSVAIQPLHLAGEGTGRYGEWVVLWKPEAVEPSEKFHVFSRNAQTPVVSSGRGSSSEEIAKTMFEGRPIRGGQPASDDLLRTHAVTSKRFRSVDEMHQDKSGLVSFAEMTRQLNNAWETVSNVFEKLPWVDPAIAIRRFEKMGGNGPADMRRAIAYNLDLEPADVSRFDLNKLVAAAKVLTRASGAYYEGKAIRDVFRSDKAAAVIAPEGARAEDIEAVKSVGIPVFQYPGGVPKKVGIEATSGAVQSRFQPPRLSNRDRADIKRRMLEAEAVPGRGDNRKSWFYNEDKAREVVRTRDEMAKPLRKTVTKEEIKAQVDEMLKDRAANEARIEARAVEGRTFDNRADVSFARKVFGERLARDYAERNDDSRIRAVLLADTIRNSGSEMGRTFAEMRDPVLSPVERLRSLINEAFHAVDPGAAEAIRNGDADARQRVLDGLARVRKAYARDGIDIEALSDRDILDRRRFAQILRIAYEEKASTGDKVKEFFVNSLISGLKTHAVNTTGNAVNLVWKYGIEKPIEQALRAVVKGDRREWDDYVEVMGTIKDGIWGWVTLGHEFGALAFDTEMRTLESKVRGDVAIGSSRMEMPRVAIKDYAHLPTWEVLGKYAGAKVPLGRAIRIPGRALGYADELMKTVAGHIEAAYAARRIARGEGLSGDALDTRVKELIADFQGEAWAEALPKAETAVFQGKLGKLGSTLLKARNTKVLGWTPAAFVVPFMVTPIQIFSTAFHRVPIIGSTHVLRAAIKGKKSKWTPEATTEFTESFSQQLGGAFALAALATLVNTLNSASDEPDETGWVGGEPFKAESRGEAEAQRRVAPYSSVGIGGTRYGFGRIEPLATWANLTKAMKDYVLSGQEGVGFEEANRELFSKGLGELKNKTFMESLDQLIRSMERQERAASFFINTATGFVPNFFRQPIRELRETVPESKIWGAKKLGQEGESANSRTARRAISRAFPFMDDTPPRRDVEGKPELKIQDSLVGRLIGPMEFYEPGKRFSKQQIDFDKRMLQASKKYGLQVPSPTDEGWEVQGKDEGIPAPYFAYQPYPKIKHRGKEVFLSDKQNEKLQELSGKKLMEILPQRSYYTESKPLTKKDIERYRDDVSRAREYARRVVRRELQ